MRNYHDQPEPNQTVAPLCPDTVTTEDEIIFAAPPFEYSGLRAQVDEIIHQGLNDMWLLIDGEEMKTDFASGLWRDGKAFAMVNDGQICLLGSRFSAVNVLLSVGISLH